MKKMANKKIKTCTIQCTAPHFIFFHFFRFHCVALRCTARRTASFSLFSRRLPSKIRALFVYSHAKKRQNEVANFSNQISEMQVSHSIHESRHETIGAHQNAYRVFSLRAHRFCAHSSQTWPCSLTRGPKSLPRACPVRNSAASLKRISQCQ